MRVFKEMNISGKYVCPICKTKDKKEVVLIPIVGKENGNNCEAIQIHLDCLNLWYDEEIGIIYQKINQQEKTG